MRKPRLLDLFCGAGGATMGYYRAGFEVVGVDIEPQPRYGFEFIQADAMTFPLSGFDVIHASPPCQAYTSLRRQHPGREYPDLIATVRKRLIEIGLPYVIENVEGAPLLNPVTICGTAFGLPLKRHRLFESSHLLFGTECRHDRIKGGIEIMNHGKTTTQFVPVYGSGGCKARHLWNEAMGIDWMTTRELTQAIPPAYTEHIGGFLIQALKAAAA